MTPQLDDDGQILVLDLHGARIAEAELLAEAAIIEAARHGRRTVRLIHGTSTTDPDGRNRTIKTALTDLVDSGDLDRHVISVVRNEGAMLLSIAPAPRPVLGRVRLHDLR